MGYRWSGAALIAAAALLIPPAQAEAQQAAPAPARAASGEPRRFIPTESLAELPLLTGPLLSPDGTKLLAMVGTAGKAKLGLIGVLSGESRGFTLPEDFDIVSYRWAGDERVLMSVGKTTPYFDDEVYMTRLISYELATQKISFVGQRTQGPEGDDILFVDPDGKWLLLSIQKSVYDYPSVFRVDLVTGKMKEVVRQRPDVWEWFADPSGVVRAGIGFTQKKWSMVYRATEDASFRRVGSARFDDTDAGLGLMRFVYGSDEGYILSSEKTGRDALYHFNYATLETGALIFESPTNDISDVLLSEDGRTVSAAYYTDVRDRVEWFDPEMKEMQAAIDQAVGSKEAWIVSRSRDRKKILVLVTGANDPGSYYYFRPDEGRMQRLAYVNEKMKGYKLSPSKPITYKARDGLVIHGYLTLPLGREAKRLPLIVMPHGGPFGVRDKGDYDVDVQLLANRGYAVLQPNYRGSESYGRDFEDRGNGQWGRAMQDDLDDGMDWLVKEGIADPKRVCIVGASYGGYAALWGATRNPERYRCAASFAGVSDIARQLRYSRDFFINRKSARKWRDRVKGEADFKLTDISPIDHVDRLNVPVLLGHGDKDQRVPPKQSSLYARALERAGKPHEYHSYPGEGHGFASPDNLKAWLDSLEAFLKKHNPPD
jgi:dipeptidyl aminopeptidase/acylaminoacyl peptidase